MLGPFITDIGNRYTDYVAKRISYRTPHGEVRVPLPYSFREVNLEAAGIPWDPTPDLLNLPGIWALDTYWYRGNGTSLDSLQTVQNKARERFMNKVNSDIQGLVNLAEYRQTWHTMASLLSAARRPTEALSELLEKYRKKAKKDHHWGTNDLFNEVLRDSSEAWLAFHFGVEPLMKDIYATAELLAAGPQPVAKPRGTAKGTASYVYKAPGWNDWSYNESYQIRCKVGGTVEITDVDKYLQNNLGFANPAAVVWELVPYSFVWDWFFSVGEWLNSLSDEYGISITNAYQTTSVHVNGTVTNTLNQNYPPSGPSYSTVYRGFRIERVPGLPSVNVFRTFKVRPWGLTRIATAVALIVQQLPRSR